MSVALNVCIWLMQKCRMQADEHLILRTDSHTCRRIQFGIKHWLALSVALALFIPLDSNFPRLPDTWFPVFAYFAVAIAMVEKV